MCVCMCEGEDIKDEYSMVEWGRWGWNECNLERSREKWKYEMKGSGFYGES